MSRSYRKRLLLHCMKGIKKLPRKEKTLINPQIFGMPREHAIFLKYCPDVRDRCLSCNGQ